MSSITELWLKSKATFETKTLSQILSFTGDGKLKDGGNTSMEFRELLSQIPSTILKTFVDNCLSDNKFDDSGFALQDVINQIGARLGFGTELGLYRGKQNDIGFDGIWTSKENHKIIVEVKTTDAYRVNLDTIADYRTKLVEQRKISKSQSSILIVVGRQDTGDLEAQIRGSRHAWDIRLISADSLLKLLTLKETLNDNKTIQQINELLKPKEYTRIDELIELILTASKDLQLEQPSEGGIDFIEIPIKSSSIEPKIAYVNFHEECLIKIQNKLKVNFIKQSKISFTDKEKRTGLICAISKAHKQGKYDKYWFAFHPHQEEFLNDLQNSYVAYGCGGAENTFLIPFLQFKPLIQNFWTTDKIDRMYWHVVIHHRDGRFLLQQPKKGKDALVDISKYRILNE